VRKITKRFIGLDVNGKVVFENDFGTKHLYVVAEGRSALGKKINANICARDTHQPVRAKPSNRRFDVVVGDPRLLLGVRVVMRGFAHILPDIPKQVKKALGEVSKIIVFENPEGNRVYCRSIDATPFGTFKRIAKIS
jgi:hypothetical protein